MNLNLTEKVCAEASNTLRHYTTLDVYIEYVYVNASVRNCDIYCNSHNTNTKIPTSVNSTENSVKHLCRKCDSLFKTSVLTVLNYGFVYRL